MTAFFLLNADRFPCANATSSPSEIEPPGLDGICDDFFKENIAGETPAVAILQVDEHVSIFNIAVYL
jgi:hypothetical protein